jgi:ABC-type cobalamin/Fe3+-siderophores transport system ATPase subunit
MDPAAELGAMDLLRDLHRGGLAVVMVSHRLEAVANYAARLAFADQEQRLWRVGTLAEMLRPEALSALYGRPVTVREENGRRFVYPEAGGGRAA